MVPRVYRQEKRKSTLDRQERGLRVCKIAMEVKP